jgi:hypothetical protein
MTWRDLCHEFATHGGGAYMLQRAHYTEAQQAAGDALWSRLEELRSLRVENKRLLCEVDGLRGDMARMTDAALPAGYVESTARTVRCEVCARAQTVVCGGGACLRCGAEL